MQEVPWETGVSARQQPLLKCTDSPVLLSRALEVGRGALLRDHSGPHSPLYCLGSHQEGHEVSPFQLLSSHKGAPNEQGAQDHTYMERGQAVRQGVARD